MTRMMPLLLLLFATRLIALQALPLHNDEGLHLTRAVEVWNLHPYWDIRDGKIINHWPMAAFYPQHAPDFVGRFPTVLVALLGMAAGMALVRHWYGLRAATWAGIAWLTCNYLFFFERMAQSDPEAGSLIVVALWASVLLAERGRLRYAVFAGVALSAAVQMKFTGAPYALVVSLIVLFIGSLPPWIRLRNLFVTGAVSALLIVPPLLYLALRGEPFFNIALGWLGQNTAGEVTALFNGRIFWEQLIGFGGLAPLWALLWGGGLASFVLLGNWNGRLLLVAGCIPPAMMIFLSELVLPRHFVVALPLLMLCAGAGWGMALARIPVRWAEPLLAVVLLANTVPFIWTAYQSPGSLDLPDLTRAQYITDHSAGFGLREAAIDLPNTTGSEQVIASMFPSSCRRANFYAVVDHQMLCVNAPGEAEIRAAVEQDGGAFVLVERSVGIGIDVDDIGLPYRIIAEYPRPGDEQAAVVLYRLGT